LSVTAAFLWPPGRIIPWHTGDGPEDGYRIMQVLQTGQRVGISGLEELLLLLLVAPVGEFFWQGKPHAGDLVILMVGLIAIRVGFPVPDFAAKSIASNVSLFTIVNRRKDLIEVAVRSRMKIQVTGLCKG
jgi:hypothetical protein